MRQKQMLSIFIILILSPLLCRSDVNDRNYWPTKEWRYSSPEQQGLNSSDLERMGNYITTKLPSADSVLIVRHGYMVFEKYYNKTSEDLRVLQSVTKSIISALLGIAIDKGLVKSLDQKMIEFFPDYDDETVNSSVRKITLRHLITMSANFGIYPDPDFIGAVFEKPLVRELGKYFVYDSSDPQIISMIVTNVSSMPAADFASKYLFKPIGIETYSWQESSGYSQGGTGLSLRPMDMARFGYLYLNQGMWNGEQIISRKWIEESTKNQISELKSIDSFTDSYGYYWWPGEVAEYIFYCAFGAGGQVIAVIPDLDIVLVTTATGLSEFVFISLLEDYIIPAAIK
jgi:CubicO group peptidase (beta-lactamase class C family)